MLDIGDERFVRHVVYFLNRERVHIRAHRNHWTGLCASKKRSHAVLADPRLNIFKTEGAKFLSDDARSSLLAVRQFRVHVKVSALTDELRAQSFGGLGYSLLSRGINESKTICDLLRL